MENNKALRIFDHQLHSLGIIPRKVILEDVHRVYEHNWFCVSQAAQCVASDPTKSTAPLLRRILDGSDDCYCNVWVDTKSIGALSIHFGGLLSIGRNILAVVRRVFVRMVVSDPLGNRKLQVGTQMSAPFTETEKETFSTKFGLEALKITDKYEAIGFNKREALVPEKRTDITSPQIKSRLSQLDGSMPHQNGLFSITSTTVGPQRINFGHHADHPFLAETAFLALTLSSHLESGYMSIQYKTEVFEGDVLESYAFGLDSGSSNSVFLVATRRVTQERKVVLIAFDSEAWHSPFRDVISSMSNDESSSKDFFHINIHRDDV